MATTRPHTEERASESGERIYIVDPVLRQGFAQLPRVVLRAKRLTDKAKLVYALLLDYAWQSGSCFPGQHRLAQDLGTTERTIRRALHELREFLLIEWRRRGLSQTNVYYILPLANARIKQESEAERTKMSGQDRTKMSHQDRTPVSEEIDEELPDPDVNPRNSKANATGQEIQDAPSSEPQPPPNHSDRYRLRPSRTGSPDRQATHAFTPIARVLMTSRSQLQPKARGDRLVSAAVPPELAACITEIAHEFGDAHHLRSNLVQALNLHAGSTIAIPVFVARLYEARAITKDRRITRGGEKRPVERPMAYFWTVVRDLLNLGSHGPELGPVIDASGESGRPSGEGSSTTTHLARQ